VARSVVAEDGVVLVLAGRREAAAAALLEADEFFAAEVPAARTLVDVAADRSLVADLRRPDFARRDRHRRIESAHLRVLGEVDDLHRRTDLQAAARRPGHACAARVLEVAP